MTKIDLDFLDAAAKVADTERGTLIADFNSHELVAAWPAVSAELRRLHKLFDDAGQDEYNVLALIDHYQSEREKADEALAEFRPTLEVRSIHEWHEDIGSVLWWKFPIDEPPYAGTPLDDDFPFYVTHWTKIIVPGEPATKGGA